jgi:hypothetical protein
VPPPPPVRRARSAVGKQTLQGKPSRSPSGAMKTGQRATGKSHPRWWRQTKTSKKQDVHGRGGGRQKPGVYGGPRLSGNHRPASSPTGFCERSQTGRVTAGRTENAVSIKNRSKPMKRNPANERTNPLGNLELFLRRLHVTNDLAWSRAAFDAGGSGHCCTRNRYAARPPAARR